MKIFIQWPTGGTLPVKISCTDSIRSLVELLGFALAPHQMITLLYNGALLHEHQTLQESRVEEDCVLEAVFHKSPNLNTNESCVNSESELDFQIDGVFLEQMRLNDLQLAAYESRRRLLFPPSSESSEDEDYFSCSDLEPETVIAQSNEICDKPLPTLWNSVSSKYENETEENVAQTPPVHPIGDYKRILAGQKKTFITF